MVRTVVMRAGVVTAVEVGEMGEAAVVVRVEEEARVEVARVVVRAN